MFFSRWFYYLSSIPTLLVGVRNWPSVVAMFLGLPARRPLIIELRNGCRFKVRSAMDIWIIKETCLDRDYERCSVDIEDGWTILDIGAGLGDFAILVAREHPHSAVYAYEPFPESFVLFQENLTLNRISNVRAFPHAIGAQSGPMCLDTGPRAAVQHSTARASANSNEEAVQVLGTTLGRVFEDLGLQRCDFLKMDCEGAEYDILFNTSKEVLCKIKHIALEYHDGITAFSHADLVLFLEEKGLRVKTYPNPVHPELGFLYALNQDL